MSILGVHPLQAVVLMFLMAAVIPSSAVLLPVNDLQNPEVVTSTGTTVVGTRATSNGRPLYKFLGIPYSQPPLGALRFMPPLALAEDAAGHVDATQFRPSCMQPPHLRRVIYRPLHDNMDDQRVSEDCLFLNVYVPEREDASGKPLAVMVWIPGEGFDFADASQYDGSRLATHGNVVVVTLNYRVSLFGFLSTGDEQAPGNVGLFDQLMALKWLRANVGRFGGDPEKITLFGRLTGSVSISALMSSPHVLVHSEPTSQQQMSNGALFRRAILQSGVAHGRWIFEKDPLSQARMLSRKVGCANVTTSVDLVECLRAIPADVLIKSAFAVDRAWRLVSGTDFLPPLSAPSSNAGRFDVIIGTSEHEGSLCLLSHMVQQTEYMAKMLDDTLSGKDMQDLVQTHVDDYYGLGRDVPLNEAIRQQYSCMQGKAEACRDQFLAFCGDLYSNSAAAKLASQMTAGGSEVYRYSFAHRPSFSHFPEFVGAAQGDEVLFVFGLVDHAGLDGVTKDEIKLSNQMMTAWSNFAKNGNPNSLQNDVIWPTYNANQEFLEINTQMGPASIKSNSADKRLVFWANIDERSL